jgi:hypothetical protein
MEESSSSQANIHLVLNEIPTSYGTRNFFTLFTWVRNVSKWHLPRSCGLWRRVVMWYCSSVPDDLTDPIFRESFSCLIISDFHYLLFIFYIWRISVRSFFQNCKIRTSTTVKDLILLRQTLGQYVIEHTSNFQTYRKNQVTFALQQLSGPKQNS